MKINSLSAFALATVCLAHVTTMCEASRSNSMRSRFLSLNKEVEHPPLFRGPIRQNTPKHPLKQAAVFSSNGPASALSISGGVVDNGIPDIVVPAFFLMFAGIMTYLIYELRDINMPATLGSKALSLTVGSLIWDNLIIAVGSIFFKDAKTQPVSHGLLKLLSFPRFTLHAVGTPLNIITVAEMGKAAGIPFLTSNLIQSVISAVCIIVAVVDRTKFVTGAGIDLATYEDSPPKALERAITRFTYKEPSFTDIIPAIILAVSSLVVGLVGRKYDEYIGNWLVVGAVAALAGSSQKGHIMTFTGNAGEAVLMFAMLQVAAKVYA